MTVKELKSILRRLPEDADLLFVSMLNDFVTSQVDDISFDIASANDEQTAFYLYSEEAANFMRGENHEND